MKPREPQGMFPHPRAGAGLHVETAHTEADFTAKQYTSCEETNYHLRVIRCSNWDKEPPRKHQ